MWKKDTEGLTRVQSSVTAHFILIHARHQIFFFFSPLPVWPTISFDHPYNFYEITKDKPAKITKVGVVSPQLFFHLQIIRILLILLVALAGASFLYSQQVLTNL